MQNSATKTPAHCSTHATHTLEVLRTSAALVRPIDALECDAAREALATRTSVVALALVLQGIQYRPTTNIAHACACATGIPTASISHTLALVLQGLPPDSKHDTHNGEMGGVREASWRSRRARDTKNCTAVWEAGDTMDGNTKSIMKTRGKNTLRCRKRASHTHTPKLSLPHACWHSKLARPVTSAAAATAAAAALPHAATRKSDTNQAVYSERVR